MSRRIIVHVDDSPSMDARLQAAADLLVAAAFGHGRYRETVLDGVTRFLLGGAPAPALCGH